MRISQTSNDASRSRSSGVNFSTGWRAFIRWENLSLIFVRINCNYHYLKVRWSIDKSHFHISYLHLNSVPLTLSLQFECFELFPSEFPFSWTLALSLFHDTQMLSFATLLERMLLISPFISQLLFILNWRCWYNKDFNLLTS